VKISPPTTPTNRARLGRNLNIVSREADPQMVSENVRQAQRLYNSSSVRFDFQSKILNLTTAVWSSSSF
jgi:hypothetical protein